MIRRNFYSRLFYASLIFALCVAAFTVLIVNFVGDLRIVLPVCACVAALVSVLFESYIRRKSLLSIGFLKNKIGKLAQGDLTQVFREDPDDLLGYNLSKELGELTGSYRQNIGSLKKTCSTVLSQLKFMATFSQEAVREFKSAEDFFYVNKRGIEEIRKFRSDLSRELSRLKAALASNIPSLSLATQSLRDIAGELKDCGERLHGVARILGDLKDSSSYPPEVARGFEELSEGASRIRKSIGELTTQTGLVKLNASIDSARPNEQVDNYGRLKEEVRLILEKMSLLSAESGNSFAAAEEKIEYQISLINSHQKELPAAAEETGKSLQILGTISGRTGIVCSVTENLLERISSVNDTLDQLDARTTNFSTTVKNSESSYTGISSGIHNLLTRFNELETKTSVLRESVEALIKFSTFFEIP